MTRVTQLVFIILNLMSPAVALAGPAEEANAVVDRWSAAYNGNDLAIVAKNYWPDAILLGTRSPFMFEGVAPIVIFFTPLEGSGNKNTIGERRTIVINDNAVVVTGFYTFTRMVEGKETPTPSRFTMLITKRGDEWRIAQHHSEEPAATDDLSKEYSVCIDNSGGVTPNLFECNGNELDHQDARLNGNYKKLMSKLSRNQKKVLLDGQRAWIILRKTNCELVYQQAGGKDGGSAARLGFSGCFLATTAARAKELESLISQGE